ncbi:MAG: 16S rRNA (adenine(1518)-N(6)/adenine(1519)-N(6))-dimethyltransferase RsmA [Candidatus Binatus sp.]|uniref:16S rRNA (adenine(1518)-N(6)/adenine(1519)-N(6))- dimethyltransferase RsmA n=1 Tax=Candidatus Binatus sp. TaxID=2811406 RepID=UPI003C70948C
MTIARKSHARRKLATAISSGGGIETPSRPAPALARAGVRPSKSRGQNFLTSGAVADRIVAAAQLSESDPVVEIGPGLGILTEKIAARPLRSLTLVELDPRLAARLRERFADGSDANARVINADFLAIDFAALVADSPVKVIGNLPFNVAAAILRRLSDNARMISRMVLMFQREVAARIRAVPGDEAYGALSVFNALYWKIDLHFGVAAGSFHPRPKIDAEVLAFTPRATSSFTAENERDVLETVRASFSAPRKTIRNALSHCLGIDSPRIARALERAAIDPGTRAEKLGVPDFLRLAHALRVELSGRIVIRDA